MFLTFDPLFTYITLRKTTQKCMEIKEGCAKH